MGSANRGGYANNELSSIAFVVVFKWMTKIVLLFVQ